MTSAQQLPGSLRDVRWHVKRNRDRLRGLRLQELNQVLLLESP